LETDGQTEQIAHLGRLALMGEMAASLAHELNQPLTAIVGNAGAGQRFLDQRVIDTKEIRELLQDIVADAERAGKIIRGIREMVRKGEAQREPVNMNRVVDAVIRLTRTDAMSRSCAIVTNLDADLPLVEADAVQLQQVLLNLILNAFDAMQQTPAHSRRILLSTHSPSKGVVRMVVRDFGIGLSENVRQQIFEHFFSTKKDGLGMGLVIARSIIESFGGILDASNAPDGGALFFFTIPTLRKELDGHPSQPCLCDRR
jgi:two-component system sensor kinase FixL